MPNPDPLAALEVGYSIPALPGMSLSEVQTPCLLLDLDVLERNIAKMAGIAREAGMALRPHGKMHKSVDVARLQLGLGGATGICCQKVSEAEAFVRGGIADILISNEVSDPAKIDRLARLPLLGAAISVCVDDLANVEDLSAAALRHGTTLVCLVEIDCGGRRCGVATPGEAVAIARAIAAAPGLNFGGVQAYQGSMQHLGSWAERQAAAAEAAAILRSVIGALSDAGLSPRVVTGGGSGSYPFEVASGLWTELQCGSYAFMDADYGRIRDRTGQRIDAGEWENALFVLTGIMSKPVPDRAICDAGLKSMSAESGLPLVFGEPGLSYVTYSDEHGEIADLGHRLAVGDRLRLVPGHCDPTCNLHDWYVVLRGDRVEALWPVTARGKVW